VRRGAHRGLVGITEGKRLLGKVRRKWEENTEMDFQEMESGGIEWIALVQDRQSWRVLVSAVMNLRVP
jgi:hypothetical protein